MSRFLTASRPSSAYVSTVVDFYREEFLKHRQCLVEQREFYSDGAIEQAEAALARILGQLDQLCTKDDAGHVVSGLLKQFNLVTGLSAWSDPRNAH